MQMIFGQISTNETDIPVLLSEATGNPKFRGLAGLGSLCSHGFQKQSSAMVLTK